MTSLNLKKGGRLQLEKQNDSGVKLKNIVVGLGWDVKVNGSTGYDYDIDATLFMLNAENKVKSTDDVIYYHNLQSKCGSVLHKGDNRTGAGDGDDEQIEINLEKLPEEINKMTISVTIYEAKERGQNFGQIENAYIRIFNKENGQELCRYDLTEDFSNDTGIVFGTIYRHNGEFNFKAEGTGFANGLEAIAKNFGI